MRGYETNDYGRQLEDEYEDEYYGQDGYRDTDADEEEEEEEEDEAAEEEPPEGQLEFLSLREKLKESIRRRALKKQSTSAGPSIAGHPSSSQDSRRLPAKDKFGSFFGPSKPVIASRVIEERRSIEEAQKIMSRDPRPSSGKSEPLSSKIQAKANGHHQKPKIVNEVKKKVETLKDNRDYSFLLSDDPDVPSSSTEEQPEGRSALAQKSDRQLVQAAGKSKASTSQHDRLSANGNGLKKPPSAQRYAEDKVKPMKKEAVSNKERAVSVESRSMLGGSSQPNANRTTSNKLLSKSVIANKTPAKVVNDSSLRKNDAASKMHSSSQIQRPQPSQGQRPPSSSQIQRPTSSSHTQRPPLSSQTQRPTSSSHTQRPPSSSHAQRPPSSSHAQRPPSSSQTERLASSTQSQRLLSSSRSERPPSSSHSQRPLSSSLPPSSSQSQRPSSSSQGQRPPSSSQSQRPQSSQIHRPLSSLQRHNSEQRRLAQVPDRVKPVQKQSGPSSKPKISRPISPNGVEKKHTGKRRPRDEDDEDPLEMIRKMFGYDPSKFADRDEDVSDMEADFDTIQREEQRSSKIAREEDEEQLRLIEEEERRERMRKKQKRQHQR